MEQQLCGVIFSSTVVDKSQKKESNFHLVKVSRTPVHIKAKETREPANLLAAHHGKCYNVEYQRRCYRSDAALPSLP